MFLIMKANWNTALYYGALDSDPSMLPQVENVWYATQHQHIEKVVKGRWNLQHVRMDWNCRTRCAKIVGQF